jgi:hypothetical protein
MTNVSRLSAALALAVALGAPARAAEREQPQVRTGPELFYLDHWDVSPPLRDLPPVAPGTGRVREFNEQNRRPTLPVNPLPKGWVDPLEHLSQQGPQTEVGVTTGLSFDGVGVGMAGYSISGAPPDTNGAVGATQYVQWVNVDFAVFNKTTGALVYGPAAGRTLWQGFGGACETYNSGDPIATYDKLAGRWVMTQFAFANGSTGPWYQCVAVSTGSDATGSYRRFAYQFTALNDYPKVGVWPDGYYISFNMFYGTPSGGYTCVLDRNNMITTSNTPGPIQCFSQPSYWSFMPADLDGTTAPPSGAPNYQLTLGSTALQLWKFKVNWATPSLSTLTGPTSISVAAYAAACSGSWDCVPQLGTTQKLEVLSDRLMYRLAYRNFGTHESLVVNHSVAGSSAAATTRWYEVRNPNGTPTLYQQGTYSPDSTSRWMGSIAQDKQGNMLLGYSVGSSSINPGIRYTGRLATDALNTMQAESTLTNGTGSQTTGLNRWGDYSAMTVDPVDDCTFWYTTEYLKANGTFNWSTRIGSFKFPGCGTTTCINSVPSTSWKGEYFPNKTLSGSATLVRDEGTGNINFAWGSGGPSTCGIGVDNFSARFTRTINFSAGTWRFSVSNDDGMRLYVDGALKLDKWYDPQVASYTVDVPLTAGNHTVVLEYYEALGGAGVTLSWAPVSGTTTFTCDDGDACFVKYGPSQYWHTQTTCGGTSLGYAGDMLWTYVNGSVVSNYVRWTPAITGAGNFEVYAWIPRCYGTSQQARYRIYHNGTNNYFTVNQNGVYDAWVSLGIHYFSAAGGEYVELTDATGESATSYRQLAFDAVNWTRR